MTTYASEIDLLAAPVPPSVHPPVARVHPALCRSACPERCADNDRCDDREVCIYDTDTIRRHGALLGE